MHMQVLRYPVFLLVIFSIIFLAAALPAQAQQAADNGTGDDISALPVSFILDNTMDSHVQDILQNIYEYEFRAAADNPAAQSELVQKRSDGLMMDTLDKKEVMRSILSRNESISPEQLMALASEMNGSIDRLNGWSKKLEDHAAGLSLLNGHKAGKDPIVPLLSDINDVRGLAGKMAQVAKDNRNKGPKNKGKSH
jgi:hypothetical protein